MKSSIWIAIFCVIAVASAYFGYTYGIKSSASNPDDSGTTEAVQPASIRGQGRLQPAGGTISIIAPPGERVEQLMVRVGETVKKDMPVVELTSRSLRELEWKLAKARRSEALAQSEFQTNANQFKLDSAIAAKTESESAQTKIDNQSKAIKPIRTSLESAQRILEKLTSMRADPKTEDLVGQSEIDKQQALVDSLEAQILQAEGEVTLSTESAGRAQSLATNQLALAQFNFENAGKLVPTVSLDLAIEMAKMGYDATQLKSPIDGKVLDIGIHPGDTVTNRPLMLIGNTKKMVCIAEITDSQMRDVKIGAAVEMTSAALESTLNGTVVEIGTMIGPPSMANPNPYAAVDRTTGKVKIELNVKDSEIASDFVNLQVEVKVLIGVSTRDASSSTSTKTMNEVSEDIEPVLEISD